MTVCWPHPWLFPVQRGWPLTFWPWQHYLFLWCHPCRLAPGAISTQIMHLHQLCQQQLFWFLGNNIAYKKAPQKKFYCDSPRQKVEHQSAILCIAWHPDGSKISLKLQILRFPMNYRCHYLFRYLKIVKNIWRDTHRDRMQNFMHTLQWKKLQKYKVTKQIMLQNHFHDLCFIFICFFPSLLCSCCRF